MSALNSICIYIYTILKVILNRRGNLKVNFVIPLLHIYIAAVKCVTQRVEQIILSKKEKERGEGRNKENNVIIFVLKRNATLSVSNPWNVGIFNEC